MLYIPFQKYDYIGGPSTFMMNLKKYCDDNNFDYSDEYKKEDDVFFAIKDDINIIKDAKNANKRIIQRLDGSQIKKEELDYIRKIYRNYTDYAIFQSEHSKNQCFRSMGKIPKKRYEIIFNGVDKSIFYPNKELKIENEFNFVITGNLIQKYKLEPSIYALDKLFKKYNFKLHVAGPVSDEVKKIIDRDYVVYHGALNMEEIAKLLRKCHVYLFTVANPPCPNSVIEAISTGIPIVSFDSGSMSELCWFAKDLLVYVSDKMFHSYNDFDFDQYTDKIEVCINDYKKYRENAIKHAHLFPFEECGKKYLNVFKKVRFIKSRRNPFQNKLQSIIKKIFVNRYTFSFFQKHLLQMPSKMLSNFLVKIILLKINRMSKKNAKKLISDISNGIKTKVRD